MATTKRFTALYLASLRASAEEYETSEASKLRVIVKPSGRASYALRYRRPETGKTAKLVFGSTSSMTLAEARRANADALLEIERGRDPGADKVAAKASKTAAALDTVRSISEECFAREGKRLRTVGQRQKLFERHVFPQIGNQPITSVKRSDLNRLADKIEDASGGRTSDLVLAYLRRVFNWYASRSDTFASPFVRGMAARVNAKERARERTLSDSELVAVWRAAEATAGPFGTMVKILLLTAARRSEVANMTWSEIDDDGTWTLPALRNKTKADLTRPLSKSAQTVFATVPRLAGSDYVFTADGKRPIGGFAKPKARLDMVSGVAGWTIHDLRRTSRSLLSRAGISADVAEMCLGHTLRGVRATYDRFSYHREKALAFEALATLIERIVNPVDNVTSLRG
jgi:integrase